MNTNLGKTKEEIIYELVLSLNKGNYGWDRVETAISQYNKLVQLGIIEESTSTN